MAKTKALISFAVTAKLICVFVFAYAKSRFSHDVAHIGLMTLSVQIIWIESYVYSLCITKVMLIIELMCNRCFKLFVVYSKL